MNWIKGILKFAGARLSLMFVFAIFSANVLGGGGEVEEQPVLDRECATAEEID